MKFFPLLFILSFFTPKCAISQWSIIDTIFKDDQVSTLYNFNSKIYFGGDYDVLPNHSSAIFEWDGINLLQISPPLSGSVNYITKFNSELIGLGAFRQFQSTTIPNGTARWDGSNWFNLSSGITDMGRILTGMEYQGSLFVGGNFSYIENVYRRCIARWDGIQWNSVGIGLSTGLSNIKCMAVYNNELYIGGYFSSIDTTTAFCIAKFDGVTWRTVGAGFNDDVKCLFVDTTNNLLYACGNFNSSGTLPLPNNIAIWNGNNWNAIGNNLSLYPNTVCLYKNQLYAGLSSTPVNSNGDTLNHIARWDGFDWQALDSGLNSSVNELLVYNNDLIVAGGFTTAGSLVVNRIARWHYSPNLITDIVDQKESFKIIPNPSKKVITVQTKNRANHFIINTLNGQRIIEDSIEPSNNFSIDISSYGSGVYILTIVINGEISSKNFIKE